MRILFWSSIALVATLQGCGAHFNSIYRRDEIGDMSVRSVDAKQRLVFTKSIEGGIIVCSEPSPDALSAGGTAVDASADTLGKITGLSFGAASSESAGSIGLRTQTISLLRDQMTQLCLRRMAGSLDDRQYSEELRQLKVSALGMLAIEQLTGAVKAPPVVVNVNAQRTASEAEAAGTKGAAVPVNLTLTASGSVAGGAEGAPSAANSDTNKAVIEVLKLVLYEGFNSLECREAKAEINNPVSDEARLRAAQNVALACGEARLTPAQTFAGLTSATDVKLVANRLSEDSGNTPAAVSGIKASASRAISRLGGTPENLTKPLQGYDITVFVCSKAGPGFMGNARAVTTERVKPLTSGRVRVEQIEDAAFQKRSGLQLGQRPVAVVFYDDAAELAYAGELLKGLDAKTRFNLDVELRQNQVDQVGTAFYLSAWLCP